MVVSFDYRDGLLVMFWRKRKQPLPRKRGLTGTGRFISNMEWTLWDDPASPGLIGFSKFDELKAQVLTPEERSRIALYMVSDAMASKGPKHTVEQEEDAKAIFEKLNAYLVDLRTNHFDQLGSWLDFNLMVSPAGRVAREDGSLAANNILNAVAAYLNCLELWGYGYSWERVHNSKGDDALLIRKHTGNARVVLKSEVQYVLGKPYRFEVAMGDTSWHFESKNGFFDVLVRGIDKEMYF